MKYSIEFSSNPKQTELHILSDGISELALKKKGMKQLDFFAFFLRDKNRKVVGGCEGDNMYGCLFVSQLWVAEPLRGQGYGTQLMLEAERFGKQHHCKFMAVNTMDWEALDFYKKMGFYVEFERKGFDKDSIFYLLRKDFV